MRPLAHKYELPVDTILHLPIKQYSPHIPFQPSLRVSDKKSLFRHQSTAIRVNSLMAATKSLIDRKVAPLVLLGRLVCHSLTY